MAAIVEDDTIGDSETTATVKRPEVELGIEPATIAVHFAEVSEAAQELECARAHDRSRILEKMKLVARRKLRRAIARPAPQPASPATHLFGRRHRPRSPEQAHPAAEQVRVRQAQAVA